MPGPSDLLLGALAAAVATGASACSDCRDRDAPPVVPVHRDAGSARRIIVPAPAGLRPLPPYAIRGDAVGPYKLGAPLGTILADVPPQVAILDISGVVHVSILRAEDTGVLVGGESVSGPAAFVAVVRPDVARTEAGIGVGSSRHELDRAMGAPLVDPRVARDPHLLAYGSMPAARFIVDGDRVTAVLLRRREHEPAADAVAGGDAEPACGSGPHAAAAITAAGLRDASPAVVSACLGSGGEAIVIGDDSLAIVAGEGDRARRLAPPIELPGLRFAAPVRGDGARDDLVVVTERADPDQHTVAVVAYRLESGRLTRSAEQDVYKVSAASAGWIGARLSDLDLLLEVESRKDSIAVSGALVHRSGNVLRDLAPLEPVAVPRRRRPAPPESAGESSGRDAAVTEAVPRDASPL